MSNRHRLARATAEQVVGGHPERVADEVVDGDVDERLRVRVADDDLIEPTGELAEEKRPLEQARRQVLVHDRADRGRRLAVTPSVGVTPVAEPDDLSPPLDAVARDPGEDELAERAGERQPAEVGPLGKADDHRLDAIDGDPHAAAPSIVITRLWNRSIVASAYAGTSVVESA